MSVLRRRSRWTRHALALLLAAVAAACSGTGPRASQPAPAATQAADGSPVVTGQAASGAVVTLTPIPPREFPLPEGPAVMDQYSKQFVPALLVARVGQTVEFLNTDDFGHNVIVNKRPSGASTFNASIDTRQTATHVFDQPGEYAVTCDLHPGMLATIYVTSAPYFATADDTGRFTLANVPPGPYTLTLTSPGGGTVTRKIEVLPGRTVLPSR